MVHEISIGVASLSAVPAPAAPVTWVALEVVQLVLWTLVATFTISLVARSSRVRLAARVSHVPAPKRVQRQKGDRHEP
jgi:hypothetical protein